MSLWTRCCLVAAQFSSVVVRRVSTRVLKQVFRTSSTANVHEHHPIHAEKCSNRSRIELEFSIHTFFAFRYQTSIDHSTCLQAIAHQSKKKQQRLACISRSIIFLTCNALFDYENVSLDVGEKKTSCCLLCAAQFFSSRIVVSFLGQQQQLLTCSEYAGAQTCWKFQS